MLLEKESSCSTFRLKWRIKICFSSRKKSKQILAFEIAKKDLRKELYLLKNKAYNLWNFSTFAAILKILHPQCIAIVVRTPPRVVHTTGRVTYTNDRVVGTTDRVVRTTDRVNIYNR